MRRILPLMLVCIATGPAMAQRGSLIEDLFRTIAEAQQASGRKPAPPAALPDAPPPGTPGPHGNRPNPSRPTNEQRTIARPRDPGGSASISVRSRQAAKFVETLVGFSSNVDALVADLRTAAARNAVLRGVMPDAYRIAADTRSLIGRCDGLDTLDRIVPAYSELDARWRQLSFTLRSTDALTSRSTAAIRDSDRLATEMCGQLGLQPQFDRHQLHDLMIVGSTHLQTILDDLPLSNAANSRTERISHDVRLMRGQMLREADRIETAPYEEVVTRFTEFVRGWSPVSQAVYELGDPHLSRRLDRFRECGDQTYALLWMPPPQNTQSLTASAHRLEQSLGQVLDQLTIRSMVNLPPKQQAIVMERSRRMFRSAQELESAAQRGDRRDSLGQLLGPIDQDWFSLKSIFANIPRLNPSTLSAIELELGVLRGALGVALPGDVFDPASLLQAAAAVEGASEYFLADMRRYERYLQPATYRQSTMDAAQEVYQHSKVLHQRVSHRDDLDSLQREAEHLLEAWQVLDRNIAELNRHGLSDRRAETLQRALAEVAPSVAQLAAALQQR
ncbi:hypothetical protein K227x_37510 [Rubripirellula lacrimiformis]|uniref:Outer membrane efflux protein n=1 Tax=Rubripirellula lacrimiformis TaxID=1930273 RepID=A0A517NDZ3_9BACT|nr:hypothetical protein [Rubripirellula lacrimiformis]QDT05351.1 hypothetical protein K227x_37510 [Rubripirellula lacrimiformis]